MDHSTEVDSPAGAVADRRPTYAHLNPVLTTYLATPKNDPFRRTLRDDLVVGFLPVVRNIARRYARRGEGVSDLEQVGTIGLLAAIERFDPAFGTAFVAFAVPTITGEIRRHFRDRMWLITVPRSLKELQGPVRDAVPVLTEVLGRAPRPSEIAEYLDRPVHDVVDALQAAQAYSADSLDETTTFSGTRTDLPQLVHHEIAFDTVERTTMLRAALQTLSAVEREIVILRFFGELSQTEIAARVGLSQMHVSRLLARSLLRMRTTL